MLSDPATAPIGKNVLTLTNVEQSENFTCVAVSKLGNIEATTLVEVKRRVSQKESCFPSFKRVFLCSSSAATTSLPSLLGHQRDCDSHVGASNFDRAGNGVRHQVPAEVCHFSQSWRSLTLRMKHAWFEVLEQAFTTCFRLAHCSPASPIPSEIRKCDAEVCVSPCLASV